MFMHAKLAGVSSVDFYRLFKNRIVNFEFRMRWINGGFYSYSYWPLCKVSSDFQVFYIHQKFRNGLYLARESNRGDAHTIIDNESLCCNEYKYFPMTMLACVIVLAIGNTITI